MRGAAQVAARLEAARAEMLIGAARAVARQSVVLLAGQGSVAMAARTV
jgi:hypothetical protein